MFFFYFLNFLKRFSFWELIYGWVVLKYCTETRRHDESFCWNVSHGRSFVRHWSDYETLDGDREMGLNLYLDADWRIWTSAIDVNGWLHVCTKIVMRDRHLRATWTMFKTPVISLIGSFLTVNSAQLMLTIQQCVLLHPSFIVKIPTYCWICYA